MIYFFQAEFRPKAFLPDLRHASNKFVGRTCFNTLNKNIHKLYSVKATFKICNLGIKLCRNVIISSESVIEGRFPNYLKLVLKHGV